MNLLFVNGMNLIIFIRGFGIICVKWILNLNCVKENYMFISCF